MSAAANITSTNTSKKDTPDVIIHHGQELEVNYNSAYNRVSLKKGNTFIAMSDNTLNILLLLLKGCETDVYQLIIQQGSSQVEVKKETSGTIRLRYIKSDSRGNDIKLYLNESNQEELLQHQDVILRVLQEVRETTSSEKKPKKMATSSYYSEVEDMFPLQTKYY